MAEALKTVNRAALFEIAEEVNSPKRKERRAVNASADFAGRELAALAATGIDSRPRKTSPARLVVAGTVSALGRMAGTTADSADMVISGPDSKGLLVRLQKSVGNGGRCTVGAGRVTALPRCRCQS